MTISIIYEKSIQFAIKIIPVYKRMSSVDKELIISKQLIRSATSIGANSAEAISAVSRKDFILRMSIALKEARETYYWLTLVSAGDYYSKEKLMQLLFDCNELISILSKIISTTKRNN